MVKMMRVLMVVGLLLTLPNVMAEEIVAPELDAPVQVAQVESKEETVVVAQAEAKEEPAVVVADADVKALTEDEVQVANIDEEILEAAEKVLAEDPSTQVASVDQDFDLNFEDFEFDEEEGI